MIPPPPRSTLFPYTTLFRSLICQHEMNKIFGHKHHAYAKRESHSRHRSEEHTSELQSHSDLVCRLLLEKKKKENKVYEPHQDCPNRSSHYSQKPASNYPAAH